LAQAGGGGLALKAAAPALPPNGLIEAFPGERLYSARPL